MIKKIIAGFMLAICLFAVVENNTGTNNLAVFNIPTEVNICA